MAKPKSHNKPKYVRLVRKALIGILSKHPSYGREGAHTLDRVVYLDDLEQELSPVTYKADVLTKCRENMHMRYLHHNGRYLVVNTGRSALWSVYDEHQPPYYADLKYIRQLSARCSSCFQTLHYNTTCRNYRPRAEIQFACSERCYERLEATLLLRGFFYEDDKEWEPYTSWYMDDQEVWLLKVSWLTKNWKTWVKRV